MDFCAHSLLFSHYDVLVFSVKRLQVCLQMRGLEQLPIRIKHKTERYVFTSRDFRTS